MLNVTVGTNTSRKKVVAAPSTILRTLLETNGVNLNVGSIHINGEMVSRDDLDKSLSELRVTDGAFIISVAKADNASK